QKQRTSLTFAVLHTSTSAESSVATAPSIRNYSEESESTGREPERSQMVHLHHTSDILSIIASKSLETTNSDNEYIFFFMIFD
ncbi:hypothetical protein PFISCL1PPCAC_15592, partial [Pristionchus fissidentatus]